MSCLAWNCCRLGNQHAEDELEALIQAQDPFIVFLSETWSEKEQVEKIRCKIRYFGSLLSQGKVGVVDYLFCGNLIIQFGWTTSLDSILMRLSMVEL